MLEQPLGCGMSDLAGTDDQRRNGLARAARMPPRKIQSDSSGGEIYRSEDGEAHGLGRRVLWRRVEHYAQCYESHRRQPDSDDKRAQLVEEIDHQVPRVGAAR